MIRRIKVLEFANKKVLVFNPAIENRYSETKVVSHAGSEVDSIVIREAKEILNYVDDSVDVIAIDEVQFFDEDIIEICDYYAKKGKREMCIRDRAFKAKKEANAPPQAPPMAAAINGFLNLKLMP